MIPISDENPTLQTPVMTWLILGATFGVWLVAQHAGWDPLALAASICNYGLVPGELTHLAPLGQSLPMVSVPAGSGTDTVMACVIDREPVNMVTPLTSMFLHGGWGHILMNSVFLWVFGNNIEDSMGPGRFLCFYLLCGLIAAAAHVASQPSSPVPTVGASGAISGVLGAYLVLYPRVRVNMLFIFVIFFRVFSIPAWVVLIWWFGLQVMAAYASRSGPEAMAGVAVWAHIGGFVAGVVLVKLFENPRLVAARNAIRNERAWWPSVEH